MRHVARLVLGAAALLLGAGAVVVVAGPAAAAQCSTSGVSVVVDFNRGAGGGIDSACDLSGGGKYASSIFAESGFTLSYVSGGGFVCKVKGAPSSADCSQTAPADAYWGLYWAKPGATSWTYSSLGVSSLKVPEGGSIAFSWQDGGTADPPGIAPAARTSGSGGGPTPTAQPTTRATSQTTSKATSNVPKASTSHAAAPGATSATAPASPSTSASASASPGASATASSSAPAAAATTAEPSPSAGPTIAAAAGPVESESAAATDGGLPWWVPVLVLLALAIGGGTAWWTRRRASGGAGPSA